MPRVRVSQTIGRKVRAATEDAVGRDMLRRGKNVESVAKRRISVSPKRVDSGRLRSSIRAVPIRKRGVPGARVGSNVKYALYVHEGTGVFGPKHAPIKPKTKRYLRWRSKKTKGYVFAKSVKGMRPNPYLRDSLWAARR